MIDQLRYDPTYRQVIECVFGGRLLCSSVDKASHVSKKYDMDCITLEGWLFTFTVSDRRHSTCMSVHVTYMYVSFWSLLKKLKKWYCSMALVFLSIILDYKLATLSSLFLSILYAIKSTTVGHCVIHFLRIHSLLLSFVSSCTSKKSNF